MAKIEKGSANVYEDLGLPETSKMLVKANLAMEIGNIIKQRELTQMEASAILGIAQPKLSAILRGQFRGVSETKMMECLNRLGRDVEIIIHKPQRTRKQGLTRVVFA
jgi:predicted XRE-type DNA-binding protein